MTRLGIAAESAGDAALLTGMADRIVVEAVPWIEPEVLHAYRTWCGAGEEGWLDVHDAFRRARALGLAPYGRFEGEPGALDARMHRAILLLMACREDPPEAVVIARDTDGQEERRRGFHQAVSERDWPFEVVNDQRLLAAGRQCGLSAFIEGVQDKVVPLLRG